MFKTRARITTNEANNREKKKITYKNYLQVTSSVD